MTVALGLALLAVTISIAAVIFTQIEAHASQRRCTELAAENRRLTRENHRVKNINRTLHARTEQLRIELQAAHTARPTVAQPAVAAPTEALDTDALTWSEPPAVSVTVPQMAEVGS